MKALKFWCFLILFLSPLLSKANHLAGGYFEYTYQGNNVYQIDFYFLRDCDGISADNPHLYLSNGCGHVCEDLGEMTQIGNSEVVDYGCGNTCVSSSGKPGYRMIHFRKDVTLGTVCTTWKLNVAIDLRNTVDYIVGSGSYYNYCMINNSVVNNSPSIDGPPIVLGCANWDAEPLYSVSASNGDAIVYDMVPSLNADNPNQPCVFYPVTYETGLSALQSFPSTAPFELSQSTGTFNFRPTTQGRSYFAVRLREYRNNVLIGETVADGMIYVTSCVGAGDVTFNSFQSTGTNVFSIPAQPGIYCATASVECDESIEDITVDAPSFVTWSVNNISSEEAEVTICVNTTGLEYSCYAQNWAFTINAVPSGGSDDCFANANGFPDRGHYGIARQPGQYCPDNLFFTNRNSQSGIPMPLFAQAEERIWVGDNMPPNAPPNVLLNQGEVIINGNAEYIAGTEIILPSCAQGTGCVTLMGNLTLKISPSTCSSECPREEIAVTVKEIFKCSEEHLDVYANGTGPFTYQFIILGDTIVQDQSSFYIHDIVSEQDNGQIPYIMNVYDAADNSGTFSGYILGTKRFYEPIVDNKIYINYPPNSIHGPAGWYFAANIGVYSGLPAYWTDSVNLTPPWYGATEMWLTVWDRWGGVINDIRHDLELQPDGSGGEDWSLNQGEFWWNGKYMNGIWADCYEDPDLAEIFNYTLKARNCYTDYDIYQHIETDEAASVVIFGCTNDDPWHPVETKSTQGGDDNNDYAEYLKYTGVSRIPEFSSEENLNPVLSISPNPANNWVEITGDFDKVTDFFVKDQTGKAVLEKSEVSRGERIDVSSLASGVYTIHCKTRQRTLMYKLTII